MSIEMRNGDVLRLRHVRHMRKGLSPTTSQPMIVEEDYTAPDHQVFQVLLLGTEPLRGTASPPFTPEEKLRILGWVPSSIEPDEVSRALAGLMLAYRELLTAYRDIGGITFSKHIELHEAYNRAWVAYCSVKPEETEARQELQKLGRDKKTKGIVNKIRGG